MGTIESPITECACMCGKGKFTVSQRSADKGGEGHEHIWEIDCVHCRKIYKIEKRGKLIGVVKKADEEMLIAERLPAPKFIKIIHKL